MISNLKPGERLDDLQRNQLVLIQNPEQFCFGMDAVLLAGFATARHGSRVLDMGTGTGVIPILMSARTEAARLTGLEIQMESAQMAARSVLLNQLQGRVDIVQGDLREASRLFGSSIFDVVTCNPPYMPKARGLENPEGPKAIARHEILCTFQDVAREAAKVLKPGGKFFLVHRPFRLAEIMGTLTAHRLEPKRLRFVHPFVDREPNMVLLEACLGGNPRVSVERPLIIYREPGVYTREICDKYGY